MDYRQFNLFEDAFDALCVAGRHGRKGEAKEDIGGLVEEETGFEPAIADEIIPGLGEAGSVAADGNLRRPHRHPDILIKKRMAPDLAQRKNDPDRFEQDTEEAGEEYPAGQDLRCQQPTQSEGTENDADGPNQGAQLQRTVASVMGLEKTLPKIFAEAEIEQNDNGHGKTGSEGLGIEKSELRFFTA